MYTLVFLSTLGFSCMMGKTRVLARATLNGLAGRVVGRLLHTPSQCTII